MFSPSAETTQHQQLKTAYPLIDSDPHFRRVVSYFRPSDYVAWASGAVAFPSALYLMGTCCKLHLAWCTKCRHPECSFLLLLYASLSRCEQRCSTRRNCQRVVTGRRCDWAPSWEPVVVSSLLIRAHRCDSGAGKRTQRSWRGPSRNRRTAGRTQERHRDSTRICRVSLTETRYGRNLSSVSVGYGQRAGRLTMSDSELTSIALIILFRRSAVVQRRRPPVPRPRTTRGVIWQCSGNATDCLWSLQQ